MSQVEALPRYEDVVRNAPVLRTDGQSVSASEQRRVRELAAQRLATSATVPSTVDDNDIVSATTSTPTVVATTRTVERRRIRGKPRTQESPPPYPGTVASATSQNTGKRNIKEKLSQGWNKFKAKLPPQLQRPNAPPEIADEVHRQYLLDTALFIGYVVIMGLLFALVVTAFVLMMVAL